MQGSSTDRFRLALEASEAAAFDWDLATDEVRWTEGLGALLGIGSTAPAPTITAWRERVHPDDIDRVQAEIERVIETPGRYRSEYRLRGADGAERWVEARGRAIASHGRSTRIVGLLLDVTQRREIDAARRERDAEFHVLADAIPTLAWTAHADGWIHWYNQRWYDYTGTTPEQMEGWGWERVHDPERLDEVKQRWRASIETGEPFEMTFPLRGADDVFRPFLTRVVPLRDAEGRVTRWFGTNTDISAERAAQHALAESDRRKDEFLATLSHELRNPLAPIRTAAQILGNPGLSGDDLAWSRQVIRRQVEHMALLLDDLLDVARITQGKLELKRARHTLATIVDAAVEAARPLIDRKYHRLSVRLPAEPVELEVDALRLSQVLSNLLTNAAKYTDPGGEIELAAEVDAATLVLAVRDNGIGIAADALPQIFKMFAQVDGTSGHADGGLGIGLSLVKGLVELHGGRVDAFSDGPGRGARFQVRLPIVASATETPSPPDDDRPPSAAAARRVLIADDNQDAADSLAMFLRLSGHEVRVAHSGRTAISVARAFRPQTALVDIGMPEIDGYGVARALREEAWAASLYLVALTGWGQDEDRERALDAGFDEHVTKPVDATALDALVSKMRSG